MKGLLLEKAIYLTKKTFEEKLLDELKLTKVTAPAFVSSSSGVQDNLNGIERPVSFTVKDIEGEYYEIIHSLAKWKRLALAKYQVPVGEGICTDMHALRPDEESLRSNIHSIFVDQWDWEKVIHIEDRNLSFLRQTVQQIYKMLKQTEQIVCKTQQLKTFLPENITFVHAEDLARLWPKDSSKSRENKICQEKKAVFIIGIGGKLSDGKKHDGRAPDYDDWTTTTHLGPGLNGDIVVWNPVLARAFEISSMGIRVDKPAMLKQLELCDCPHRAEHDWHRALLNDEMPLSIGGGIGQSRTVMLLLQRRHIGEVQVGAWPVEVIKACKQQDIELL